MASFDLDTLDDIPTPTPTATAGPGIAQNITSTPYAAAPQNIKTKKAGSMEELEFEDDDGPVAMPAGQTGMAPATHTPNYYQVPVHQPPAQKKKEYMSKKPHGSMDELDIDMDEDLTVKPTDQSVTAMNQANCQAPTSTLDPIFDAPAPAPLDSSHAPFIETSTGDLVPNVPKSPRTKEQRYNTDHWSGLGHTHANAPKGSNPKGSNPTQAPIIDCSLDQPMSISGNCINTDKPQLLEDGSFDL